MSTAVLVGIGALLGGLARFYTNALAVRWLGPTFPFGTFIVNLSGCLAVGLLAGLALERGALSPGARLFWLSGFLGAYTTFSAFGYETLLLLRQGDYVEALVNVGANVVLGVAAVWLGLAAIRLIP